MRRAKIKPTIFKKWRQQCLSRENFIYGCFFYFTPFPFYLLNMLSSNYYFQALYWKCTKKLSFLSLKGLKTGGERDQGYSRYDKGCCGAQKSIKSGIYLSGLIRSIPLYTENFIYDNTLPQSRDLFVFITLIFLFPYSCDSKAQMCVWQLIRVQSET